MGKFCAICGRGKQVGNNVSHSHRKTKRSFQINLQKKLINQKGCKKHMLVCTKCLKDQMKAPRLRSRSARASAGK